jgi:hypothetical protein
MFSKTQFVLILVLSILFVSSAVTADINDHFNSGSLDPAWNTVYSNASNWTYSISGSKINVTDIGGAQNPSSTSRVYLQRNFSAPGDFQITSGLSWDSKSTTNAMQSLYIEAWSGSSLVALGGYGDWWVSHNGQKYAAIQGGLYEYRSGMDTLDYTGSLNISMQRTNGTINILANGSLMLSEYCNSPIDKVMLEFAKENYPSGVFGTLSVDYVTAVPEPATICLFAFAGLMLRRKK